jgi:hypothetical protein
MHALYDALRARKITSDSPGSGYSRCARAMHFSIAASLSFALSVCAPASDTNPATAKPNSRTTKRPVLVFTAGLPSMTACLPGGVSIAKRRSVSFWNLKKCLCARRPARSDRRTAAKRTGTISVKHQVRQAHKAHLPIGRRCVNSAL